ncbi:helix-turn-helix domain-containing protein [Streptomyces sp. NPDC055721]|uniref:helix-turn-helix domain-containing protein n=1 Tax=Streptomyces sp. NPDC127132 TaxID=3345374 RepID=UPI00363929C6
MCGGTPVAALASSLGYASESAFSNAFKRATGMAPRHYRHAPARAVSRSVPVITAGRCCSAWIVAPSRRGRA